MISTNKILWFNLAMAILSFLSYLFMVYLFQLLRLNDWYNLVFFIGYVPLRGVGFILMPNFPIFVFTITIGVNAYYLNQIKKKEVNPGGPDGI